MENSRFSFFIHENRRRGIRNSFVRIVACFVVFCTTYSLILPGITMQSDAYCGAVEHIHSQECYTCSDAPLQMVCGDALQSHVHTETCTDDAGTLVCGFADFVLHTHDSLCYSADGAQICTLPQHMTHEHTETCYASENPGHTHDETCYGIQLGSLVCTEEETEGHAHAGECYEQEGTLVCELAEQEGHTHEENCYLIETVLSCGQESHPHIDACYTQSKTVVCGEEEREAHAHADSCYAHALLCQLEEKAGHKHDDACYEQNTVLVCTLEESEASEPVLVCGKDVLKVHTHDGSCRDENGALVCGLLEVAEHIHTESCLAEADEQPLTCTLEENEEHQHGQMCYGTWTVSCTQEEHEHGLSCHSNPEADLETEEIWKRTFADVELTGSFADDLAAIARTQNGYAESKANYQVQEDGIHIKGYTRYGAWAGEPYADWNAHFVAFCASYAQISEKVLPTAENARLWVEALSDEKVHLYYSAENYKPKTGDLIFLHVAESEEETEEEKSVANFMGIVLSCTDTAVTYIAGDSHDEVAVDTVTLSDTALLGYGRVISLPMASSKADETNDVGAGATVTCLDAKGQDTESYAGLEPFELRVAYNADMQSGQTYTLTLDKQFNVTSVEKQWGDGDYTFDEETRTVTFTPKNTMRYGGELHFKGTIASYDKDEALTVSPVTGNSKTVTITKNPENRTYYYPAKIKPDDSWTVKVELLEPKPSGSMASVSGIRVTPVDSTNAMYSTMLAGEKREIGNSRIYEHKMFTVEFVDENGEVVEVPDLSARDVTITVAGTENMKGAGTEGVEMHAFYRNGNNVQKAAVDTNGAITINGGALTNKAFMVDVITVNPSELAEGTYGGNPPATFKYNYERDAFIYNTEYAKYYNEDSPLGTAGSFHLVAFGNAYLNSHTNGNILAYNLYAYNNFGTNQKDGYEGFRELHYVQNYKYINANSSARDEDILVIGSAHTMGVINGNEFEIDGNKIGKPKNVIQDDDSNVAPFIDLHRVETEIRAISTNLGAYETIENPATITKHPEEFIIATELNGNSYGPKVFTDLEGDAGAAEQQFYNQYKSDDPYLMLLDKDNIGVWNATPAEIKALAEKGRGLAMKGFESGGSGAIIVNVNMKDWPADQVLELPDSRVYVDGKMESASETLDFSAGKVIWNFTNADGKQIKTKIMTGMVVAPGATVTISQNLNGTVVAENIDVKAESHRTDFVGKIYKNEFRTDAHIHIHKVDKGNYGKLLSGAKFQLEKYVGNGNWEIASYVEEDDLGLTVAVLQQGITDNEGKYLFKNLEYNTVYRLTETEAPAGYVLDTTPRYFYYEMAVEGETELPPKPDDFSSLNFVNTTADGDCVHYHFTNTEKTPDTTSISVNKVWNFGYSGLHEAPVEEVYYHVYQIATTVTGEEGNQTTEITEKWYGMYPVTKANGWESTIHNLPSQTSDGETTYSYYVKEVSVPGFDSTYSVDKDHPATGAEGEQPIVITNTASPYLFYTSLNVEKKWYESDGRTQIANPETEKVSFLLYQRTTTDRSRKTGFGTPVLMGQYTLTKDNQWKWSRMGLVYEEPVFDYSNWRPQYLYTLYYDYYLVETPVEGYTSDVKISSGQSNYFYYTNATITNTKDPTTSVSLEKKWYDEDGTTALTNPPVDEITVQLQRMTKFMSGWENYGDPITVTKDMNWQHTVDELPMYDNSRNIYYYRFVESEIDGFKGEYTFEYEKVEGDYEEIAGVTGVGNGGKVIIHNKKLETTSININKVWIAAGEGDTPIQPEGVQSITVQIYREKADDKASREAYGDPITITRAEDGTWSYEKPGLPKTDSSGTPWIYSVEEQAVPGFIPTYGEVTLVDGKYTTTITNKARTGYTHIGVKKIWDMLDEDANVPEDANVTVALYQRVKREGWTGDTYVDTATAETIPVNFNFNGTTYTVNGYPGETVALFMNWQKEYDTDDVNNAYHNVTPKTGMGASVTPVESEHKLVESGHQFKFEFAIPQNVEEDWNGNKYINIEHGMGNNNRWTYDSLVVIPNARVKMLQTREITSTIEKDESGKEERVWVAVFSPLPASEEIGGVTVGYTYFVEETAISGNFDNDIVFETAYTYKRQNEDFPVGSDGIPGGDITITNSQKDIYTDLSVNKKWEPDGVEIPDSVTYELHQVASTIPGDAGEAEMVNVSFEIKDDSGTWQNCLEDLNCPKGSTIHLEIVSKINNSVNNLSWCVAEINGESYAAGQGVTMINGHPGYAVDISANDNMTIAVYIGTSDLQSNWTVTATAGSTIKADTMYARVELKASEIADENWKYTHTNLPTEGNLNGTKVYYSYYVKETMVDGKPVEESGFISKTDKSGNAITITNTAKEEGYTSVTVDKVWQYEDGTAYTPSASDKVTLKLMQVANGTGGAASGTEQVTFTLNIPIQGADAETREVTVAKGTMVYFEVVTAGDKDPWVQNISGSAIYSTSNGTIDGQKHFYYEYKVESNAMYYVYLSIYSSGIYWDVSLTADSVTAPAVPTEKLCKTITLSNETGWSYTFSRLPENDGNGTTYSYYVVEENGEEYDVQYSGGSESGTITVTNTVDGPRYELPHTGGSALGVYLLGWLMTAAAGIGLVGKKRRKR